MFFTAILRRGLCFVYNVIYYSVNSGIIILSEMAAAGCFKAIGPKYLKMIVKELLSMG